MSFAVVDKNGRRIVVLSAEPEATCELCGQQAELRPYGPKGENICYPCGEKDPAMTEKRLCQVLFGEKLDS